MRAQRASSKRSEVMRRQARSFVIAGSAIQLAFLTTFILKIAI
jgi:hypothetical protein